MRAQPVLVLAPTPHRHPPPRHLINALDPALQRISAPYSSTATTTCIYCRPLCTTKNNNSLALVFPLHSYSKSSRIRDDGIWIYASSQRHPGSESLIAASWCVLCSPFINSG